MKTLNILVLSSVSFFIGALCLFGVIKYFGVDKVSLSPAYLTVFLIPTAFCLQAIYKLNDLNESLSLTNSEVRRFNYIVGQKRKVMFSCVIFYILSAIFMAISMSIHEVSVKFKICSLIVSGGLLGVMVFTAYIIYRQLTEVSNFKAKMVRHEQNKNKRKMS